MRTYPKLTEQATSRDFIEAFGGYNHNLRIGENEFYDMKNLSSSNYPVLSTRERRGIYEKSGYFGEKERPVATLDKDGLLVVTVETTSSRDPSNLRIRSDKTTLLEVETIYDYFTERKVVSMGAYIVIFPDNIYINTADLGKTNEEGVAIPVSVRNIEASFSSSDGNTINYTLCKMDGTAYKPDTTSKKEPTDVEGGHIWLDTSVVPNSLKLYSSANKMWTPIASTYIKIECTGIGANFEVGDAVRFSGVTPVACESINFDKENVASIIQAKDDDSITIIGIMKDDVAAKQEEGQITVKRVMPTMDFIFESNNRLWGCRYGENRDGKIVNEIYASKLGDFTNWEYFAGTSQDSYMVSLGADGEFTGAISYLGKPLFFRQSCIHTIYGGYPAQYQLQTTECQGVQKYGGNSLVVIDGVLYYKSVNGVCAYTGSMPTEIGTALGDNLCRYRVNYAAGYKKKFYLQLASGFTDFENGIEKTLFVYDTEKGLWHKEGAFNGEYLCSVIEAGGQEHLYYIENQTPGLFKDYWIKMIEGTGEEADGEEAVDWFAETGVIGCSSPDKKYISRMSIRLSTKIGARVYVLAEYDSSGTWEQIGAITSPSLNTFTFPIRPKRCDHFRLRIVGTDEAKIYSISKTLEQGSDF